MIIRRLSLNRVLPIAALAAVLAIAVAVAPSFAGSFLTSKRAARVYLSSRGQSPLPQEAGSGPEVPDPALREQGHAPLATAPVAAASASNAVFGPTGSTTPVDIPTSGTTFEMPDTGLVKLTFTGASNCTGDVAGVPCPVQILVDGLSIGQVPFDIYRRALAGALGHPGHGADRAASTSPAPSTRARATPASSSSSRARYLFAEGFPGQ